MTVGIPRRQFYRELLPMVRVVVLYGVVGVALGLSIFSLCGKRPP